MLQQNFPNTFLFIGRSYLSYFWFKADKVCNPVLVRQAMDVTNFYRTFIKYTTKTIFEAVT